MTMHGDNGSMRSLPRLLMKPVCVPEAVSMKTITLYLCLHVSTLEWQDWIVGH